MLFSTIKYDNIKYVLIQLGMLRDVFNSKYLIAYADSLDTLLYYTMFLLTLQNILCQSYCVVLCYILPKYYFLTCSCVYT